jgi:hypothetical protein
VVRHLYTPKLILKKINETLKINPIKNAGIVFNGVKMNEVYKSKNHYGYYDYYSGSIYSKERKLI